jgi:aromatic ring-opening dioxygenase catalytic subunit (LigB family)
VTTTKKSHLNYWNVKMLAHRFIRRQNTRTVRVLNRTCLHVFWNVLRTVAAEICKKLKRILKNWRKIMAVLNKRAVRSGTGMMVHAFARFYTTRYKRAVRTWAISIGAKLEMYINSKKKKNMTQTFSGKRRLATSVNTSTIRNPLAVVQLAATLSSSVSSSCAWFTCGSVFWFCFF